jgi:hypothetical protein
MKNKIKHLLCFMLISLTFSCIRDPEEASKEGLKAMQKKEQANSGINALLDSVNIAAAEADFKSYFTSFAPSATYNGTDATENWDQAWLMVLSKPKFDAKKTWNFKSIKRNIYRSEKYDDIAWFDELLNTPMKICRGSGVVIKENGKWKIQQYVLSVTVPKSKLDAVVALKATEEDVILNQLKK